MNITTIFKVHSHSAFLPPANELCEGYVFTGVCDSVNRGRGVRGCSPGVGWGLCGCSLGGHAWLLMGGVRGCSWGVRMVAQGGHAWLLDGACMVAHGGGMHGCLGGVCGCLGVCVVARGACVVAHGGACMVARGGMRGCSWGGMHRCSGACVVSPGGMRGCSGGGGACVFFFLNEVRSMSGRYASYWNAFLFFIFVCNLRQTQRIGSIPN